MNISTRNHVNDSQKLSLTCLLRRILLGTRDYSLILCKKSRRATSQVTQICPYYVCHVECRARRGDVDLPSLIDDRQQQYREKFCIKHSWNVEHTPFWHIYYSAVHCVVPGLQIISGAENVGIKCQATWQTWKEPFSDHFARDAAVPSLAHYQNWSLVKHLPFLV